jgi:hypothetical protein
MVLMRPNFRFAARNELAYPRGTLHLTLHPRDGKGSHVLYLPIMDEHVPVIEATRLR